MGQADDHIARSWDDFYDDPKYADVPFLADVPDESLVDWHGRGLLPTGGRAIDLGCGPGRNALWLARHGFEVEGVDLSGRGLALAAERAEAAGLTVAWHRRSIFDHPMPAGAFALVHDAGLLHHLAPAVQRRYVARVLRALEPGSGRLSLTCFAPESDAPRAADAPDQDAASRTGWSFTPEELLELLADFEILELRRMVAQPAGAPRMGADFLWVVLAAPGPSGGA